MSTKFQDEEMDKMKLHHHKIRLSTVLSEIAGIEKIKGYHAVGNQFGYTVDTFISTRNLQNKDYDTGVHVHLSNDDLQEILPIIHKRRLTELESLGITLAGL